MITIKTNFQSQSQSEGVFSEEFEGVTQDKPKILVIAGGSSLPYLIDIIPYEVLMSIEFLTSEFDNYPTTPEEFFQDDLILNNTATLEDRVAESYTHPIIYTIPYINQTTTLTAQCYLKKHGNQRTVRPP